MTPFHSNVLRSQIRGLSDVRFRTLLARNCSPMPDSFTFELCERYELEGPDRIYEDSLAQYKDAAQKELNYLGYIAQRFESAIPENPFGKVIGQKYMANACLIFEQEPDKIYLIAPDFTQAAISFSTSDKDSQLNLLVSTSYFDSATPISDRQHNDLKYCFSQLRQSPAYLADQEYTQTLVKFLNDAHAGQGTVEITQDSEKNITFKYTPPQSYSKRPNSQTFTLSPYRLECVHISTTLGVNEPNTHAF